MALDNERIRKIFQKLDKRSQHLSPPGTLVDCLDHLLKNVQKTSLEEKEVALFGSAAVEMWHRAIHSLLVSVQLMSGSKLWSAVCGYYASHYVMRAFAHVWGHYTLFQRGTFEVGFAAGRYTVKKRKSKNEHVFYWNVAASNLNETNLFCVNSDDIRHRSVANYRDHVNRFQTVQIEEESVLREHINRLAGLSPIKPSTEKFPDLAPVQALALRRITFFRDWLDDTLEGKSRYWKGHRDPFWCRKVMTYSVHQ